MPYIVRQCVEEIERRGMEEVGIYRVSGVATDIQALKAAFDISEYLLGMFPILLRGNQFRAACCDGQSREWDQKRRRSICPSHVVLCWFLGNVNT